MEYVRIALWILNALVYGYAIVLYLRPGASESAAGRSDTRNEVRHGARPASIATQSGQPAQRPLAAARTGLRGTWI